MGLDTEEQSVVTIAEETVITENGTKIKKKKRIRIRKALCKAGKSMKKLVKKTSNAGSSDNSTKGTSKTASVTTTPPPPPPPTAVDMPTIESNELSPAATPGQAGTEMGDYASDLTTADLSQLLLLLLDPVSRRFEILSLDIDLENAEVGDVLMQIPESTTEELLQKLKFVGLCFTKNNSINLTSTSKLKELGVQANDLLIAVCEGSDVAQMQEWAQPILTDPAVASVLKQQQRVSSPSPASPESNNSSPKAPGDKSPPSEISLSAPNKVTEPLSSSLTTTSEISKKNKRDKTKNKGLTVSLLIALLVLLVSVVYRVQEVLTTPIVPGDVLKPGSIRSKCGFYGLLPEEYRAKVTRCSDPMKLEMKHDGVLALYNGGTGLAGKHNLVGEFFVKKKNNQSTYDKPSAQIDATGRVFIGEEEAFYSTAANNGASGGPVTIAEALTPWPFAFKPQIRTKKRKG